MPNDPLGQLELEEGARIDATEKQHSLGVPKKAGDGGSRKRFPVVEIFGPTLQGEGAMAGVRTSFIRFGGCDYRCAMCDSLHAVIPEQVKLNSTYMTAEDITQRLFEIHIGGCDWVTFSGGNPCMHKLDPLVILLKDAGIKIAAETQGTLLPSWLHMCDVITVSPKSPGMGEEFELPKFVNFLNSFQHHKGFNVKIVVFSMQDIEFAAGINAIMKGFNLEDQIYLSLGNPYPPQHANESALLAQVQSEGIGINEELKLRLLDEYRQLAEDLLQLPYMSNVKFLPQLHVLAWANKQGV